MSDTFRIRCWNCGKVWSIQIKSYDKIGYRKDLNLSYDPKKLVVGSGDRYSGVQCEACGMYGNHRFNFKNE